MHHFNKSKIIFSRTTFILLLSFVGKNTIAQVTPPSPIASTTKMNYVRTWTATAPEQSATNLITRPLTDVKQTTDYFNGSLPVESVAMKASPAGNDMVSAKNFDATTGLEIYSYLPFTSNVATSGDITNDGNFKLDPFQQQVAFYNTYLTNQAGETNIGASHLNWAYSKTNYEASPVDRPLNTFAPGVNWVGSEGTTNHNVQLQNLLNTATDNVQIWNIPLWDITNPQTNIIPTSSGAYSANQLFKKIVIDENGYQTISFTDKYGQLILKKQQTTTTVSDNGSGSAHANWLCTYYVYDDMGNLRFVITPREVQLIDGTWSISVAQSDELCYRYEYDVNNHLIVSKIPGRPTGSAGETWTVYDQRNRLVLKQDPNLRVAQKWQYLKYDNLDRVSSTGLITDPTNYNNLSYHITNAATSGNSGGFSYWPVLTSYTYQVMTQTFYDDYSWMNSTNSSTLSSTIDATTNGTANTNFTTSYNASPVYAQQMTQSNMTRGMVMGSKTTILDGSGYLYAVSFYDSKGRLIQSQSLNVTGGKDIITTQYDWSGKVLNNLVSTQYVSATNPQTHNIFTASTYDAMGRLLTTTKKVNSTINGVAVNSSPTPATILSNQYDELSKLKSKQLAPYFTTFNSSGLEKLTYDYNVRGWSLGMNRDYAKTPFSSSNYFGYDLGYDKTSIVPTGGSSIGTYSNPLYDGNIGGLLWKSKGDGAIRKYDYTYDVVGRLMQGAYLEQSLSIPYWNSSAVNYTFGNMTYDANGNLLTMDQYGFILGGSTKIDQLVYNYTPVTGAASNKLFNVIDNSSYNSSNPNSILGDFHYAGTKTTSTTDYVYDNDGNVITDNNRAASITYWNFNNMPNLITISGAKNGSTIQYIYDAEGDKLKKIVTDKSVAGKTITTTTIYIGECVYKTVATNPVAATDYKDVLQFITHEAGRIRFVPGSSPKFVFDYFIPDHLGNVRMVLTDEVQTDMSYAATLENASFGGGTAISLETNYFNINTSDVVNNPSWLASASGGVYANQNNGGNPPNTNPYSNYAANSQRLYQLCGNTTNNPTGDRYGLGIVVKVMAGDRISIYGKSVYHLPTGQTIPAGSYPVSAMLSSFINSFAGTSTVQTGSHSTTTGTYINNDANATAALNSFLNNANTPGNSNTTPKAGICWILFDDQFRPVSASGGSGFDPVNLTSDVVKTHNLLSIPMIENGYLYVYCSNESNINVYFDNLQVVENRGPALEETHYYPYGLAMAGISDRSWNKQINFDHFQGNEMQDMEFADGSGLEEYDFEARYYDPQLGIWHSPDPGSQFPSPYVGMGNDWVNGTDLDGKFFGIDDLIVSAVGLLYGYVSSGISTGKWGGSALLHGLLDAAEFEVGYLTSGGGLAASSAASVGGAGSFSAATTFLENSGANIAINQMFPTINVPISNHFDFSFGPSFSVSKGIGESIGLTYSNDDFAIGVNTAFRGNEFRVGGGVSYFDRANNQTFSASITHFGGNDAQELWQVGYQKNSFSFDLTDDWKLSGDKYRTFAAQAGIDNFSLGATLYSNESSHPNAGIAFTKTMWNHDINKGASQWTSGSRISSALYLGFKDGNNIYRAGIDAPFVFDFFENGFHSIGNNTPRWNAGYGAAANPYFYVGSYDPYSLY